MKIYVPKHNTTARAMIDQGSGIVGRHTRPGELLVYFEGNRYGAMNLGTWHERVLHAAGRMLAVYPTVAKMLVRETDLIEVGEYDSHANKISLARNQLASAALADWLIPDNPGGDAA